MNYVKSYWDLFAGKMNEIHKMVYKVSLNQILLLLSISTIINLIKYYFFNSIFNIIDSLAITSILVVCTFIVWISGVLWNKSRKRIIDYWSLLYLFLILNISFNLFQLAFQLVGKYIIPTEIQTVYYAIIYIIMIIYSNFLLLKIIALCFRFNAKQTIFTFVLFLALGGILFYFVNEDFGLVIPFFLIGR